MSDKEISELEKFGATIFKMENKSVLEECSEIIQNEFHLPTDEYCKMGRDEFSTLAVGVQDKINSIDVQRRFVESEGVKLKKILKSEKISYQSICFLRAVRPQAKASINEAPDFHRETFYSDTPETTKHMLNIWIPIKNVNEANTLKYVPGSHKIPDDNIQYDSQNKLTKVDKFSNAHKLGFFWAPKEIKSGVDLNKAVPAKFNNELGEYLAFSSMTIHGGAFNLTDKIRFVVGFGLIASEKITENKDYYASGAKYFLAS